MTELIMPCTYFAATGPANTPAVLRLAQDYAAHHPGNRILVASTSGRSGALACQALKTASLVITTHSSEFAGPGIQELLPEYRAQIEASGARILTAAHAFGGVGRAVRRKFGTYQVDEIIAHVLRTFSEGVKVGCEITLMAADAGLVNAGKTVLALAGTGSGLDTAVVIRAAPSQDYFDLRVLELLCKPLVNARPS